MIQQKQVEVKAKRVSKVERLDMITALPQAIVETILCLLPVEEAARTSVLSREWRFKWTTIPKLVFFQDDPPYSGEMSALERAGRDKDMRSKLLNAIHQILLLRQGPIHEFDLTMDAHHTCFEIDQIILHLSRNHTVKKLTFDFYDHSSYGLPLSFFSLRHLTDLSLENCDLNHKPVFNGFDSLTSLSMTCVKISKESLLHLLYSSPSLKRLHLCMYASDFHDLKYPSIVELFKCLLVIEHLTTVGDIIPYLVKASVPEELPTSPINLKYCSIELMCSIGRYGLPFLAALIKCSPNLEKLELQCDHNQYDDVMEPHKLEDYSIILEKHSNVWLEHLIELEIYYFSNLKPELEFVKFILARSPKLKKVKLRTLWDYMNQPLELLKDLLSATRASPAEIVIC